MLGRVEAQPLARARLLGGFQLSSADGAAIALPSRRARALLGVVILDGEGGVLRERICGLLWGDRAEDQARASLRQCLFELKAGLGELADALLDVGRERIAVRPGRLDSDVAQVRRVLAAANAPDLAALAATLAAGQLLEGLEISRPFQDWLDQARGVFEAGLAGDVAGCLERLEGEGRWEEVIRLADGYLRRDPLNELVAAAAIRAERAGGRHAAGQRRLRAITQALADELGVAPGPALLEAAHSERAAPALSRPAAAGPPTETAPDAGGAARGPVLAVLAFDNLSGDAAMAYLSDGVSDEIHQAVAQGSDLKVIARSSSFQFRGGDKAARRVASELQATHLLDGSVRRSGDRVRISAQLVQCDGEVTLWTRRFDGDLGDVFALQDEIAQAVAQALEAAFSSPARPERLDPAAYELFLRARATLSEGGQFLDPAGAAAVPLLEQAVAIAPAYAAAWELLAKARAIVLRAAGRRSDYAEGRAGVVAAAETALRLDPRRGGAYEALARLEPWGAYGKRERLLAQAMALGPNDADALTDMSTFCWSVGRFREALAHAQRACELNPLMPAARLQVAQMLVYVGDYEAGVRMFEDVYRRWPGNFEILVSLLNNTASLGFWDVHNRFLPEATAFDGWQAKVLRETLRYTEGLASRDPAAAEQVAERYEALLTRTGTLPLNFIEALSALGLTARAFELADRASFDHMFDPDGPLPSGNFPGTVLGRWSALNKTPRFIGLCERLGLCGYWNETQRWPDCVEWAPFDFKAEARRHAQAAAPAT
jgi:TolB-like protein/DNA-binding SARP family transcriptional activator